MTSSSWITSLSSAEHPPRSEDVVASLLTTIRFHRYNSPFICISGVFPPFPSPCCLTDLARGLETRCLDRSCWQPLAYVLNLNTVRARIMRINSTEVVLYRLAKLECTTHTRTSVNTSQSVFLTGGKPQTTSSCG